MWMSFKAKLAGERIIPAAVAVLISGSVYDMAGPILVGGGINIISAGAMLVLVPSAFTLSASILVYTAGVLDLLAARQPTGRKGTSGWVKRRSQIKRDLTKRYWAPYWGVLNGQELFADYASNALTIGTAGSGKGVGVVQPMILSIHESKTVVDFKGELACVLAPALRRRGEIVHVLNLGDLWTEQIGESDIYNPLCILAENYSREGGLLDIDDDMREMCLQLLPEPAEQVGRDGDGYFRDGSRSFIGFAAQMAVMLDGPNGTLGDVAQMLNDRKSLLWHALWASGRLVQTQADETPQDQSTMPAMPIAQSPWADRHHPDELANYITYFRGLASGVADLLATEDSRTADSFITGAQQALRAYNISTRAHRKTKGASFRFASQKEGGNATTVFIIADASKIEAQKPVLGLLQWCMLQELKRHPNKERPVYLIADEASNFIIAGLKSLLTWGRGYGLRLHLIIQSLSAFRDAYGGKTADVLLSETEIKQFLPGQREPETLQMIEKLLGEQSIITESRKGSLSTSLFAANDFDLREESRALMTADEIRRTDKTILVLRKNKPALTDLPPIAAIHPFRGQIAINPFHGKPFRRRIALRLSRRKKPNTKGGLLCRIKTKLFPFWR